MFKYLLIFLLKGLVVNKPVNNWGITSKSGFKTQIGNTSIIFTLVGMVNIAGVA